MRLDDAVLAVWSETAPKGKGGVPPAPTGGIPVTDTVSLRDHLRSLAPQKRKPKS